MGSFCGLRSILPGGDLRADERYNQQLSALKKQSMSDQPTGFQRMPSFGPLHEVLGPIFVRSTDVGIIVGMHVEERHHNKGPMLHGGMMAFFIDTAFTYACVSLGDRPRQVVTTALTIDFAGSAKAGDWIEAHVDVLRQGRRVVFLNCFVFKGDERIARGSATFQVISAD